MRVSGLEYLKYIFFSIKIFLSFFILFLLFPLVFGATLYIAFMQSYYFTSVTILLPGIPLIFSGEKPLNPLAYTICVVLFIIISSFTFYNLSSKPTFLNNFINKVDIAVINFILVLVLIGIILFPYFNVMDFF
jgi:hypothetical protein